MLSATQIEATSFKQVEGGHVFHAPNPWVFGPGTCYLVNDTQKAELLALMKPHHLRNLLVWLAVIVWVLASSAVFSAVSGHDQMMTSDLS